MSSRLRSKPCRQRLTTSRRFPIRLCFATIAAFVLNVVFSMSQSAAAQSTFSSNGKIAFVSDRDGSSEIYVMNPNGSDQRNISHNSAADGGPAWSSDGRKIAFSSNRDGHFEIYVMNADGTGVTRLTYDFVGNSAPFSGIGNFAPDWSPDGTKIAFTSWRGDLNTSGRPNDDIYVMNANGSNQVRLTNDPSEDFGPDWSPDGTRIAFTSNRNQIYDFQIHVMKADGSGQTNITKNRFLNFTPEWSPDGTKIVFVSLVDDFCDNGRPCGISVMNADGSNQVGLDEFYGDSPVWSPDGTRIAYVDYLGLVPAVNVMNADGSNRTRLNEGGHSPAWQPLLAASPDPIDDAQFFVTQHYLDFLNREPDAGGLAYWTDRITQCGTGARCVHERRIGVSAAFFVELEFQQTGYVVYRLYRTAYGTMPNAPSRANMNFSQFMADRAQLVGGQSLQQSTIDFANNFATRPEFKQAYPDSISPADFVNTLFNTANLMPFTQERQNEMTALINGTKSRAQVLLDVIEIQEFENREYNPAFVLMQYFGYLRRDIDQGGYDFWLDVVNNREPNNFRGMVCAFITSAEYQLRFGSVVTRSNTDCGQ